jgi:ubiquinone/menaquinone biosynthesis C-methylase UbiE
MAPERMWDEQVSNPMLLEYQQVERDYIITKVRNPKNKIFIDIGAGYGRILPWLTPIAGRIWSIESDQEMFEELQKRANKYNNVYPIQADANKFPENLHKRLNHPVFLLLQNTLGTWKGDYHEVLKEIKKVALSQQGEVIISLLNQKILDESGTIISPEEREKIIVNFLGGRMVGEIIRPAYHIFHIDYAFD